MKIPITFLGTGQGIPTKKRNHSSIFLSYKEENILIDCGEGTQRQFRIANLNPCKITKLLISHWHGDHILGIPGLLETLALNNYNKTLQVYGPKGTKRFFSAIEDIFVRKGKLNIEINEASSGKIFENEDLLIEAEEMFHGTPCLAYSITEKEKIRINKDKLKKYKIKGKIISELQKGNDIEFEGKKIKAKDLTYKQEQKKVSIIMDTVKNKAMEVIAKNSDLLICESTYSKKEIELAKEHLHLTAEQAAETAKKTKSKRLILTHISQRYEYKEKEILAEAKKIFPNTEIAFDFMNLEI